MKLVVLHGPNLSLLGTREPEIYGRTTLHQLNQKIIGLAQQKQASMSIAQSNAEHVLIDHIHDAKQTGTDFIIINPGALTHTSVALRDSFLATQIPFIEIHISNIFARESFRQHSYLSDIAVAIISGMGTYGYELALLGAINHLKTLSS